MDNTAFARARRFLKYRAVAQWLAIGSSVLTAVLFFTLILLLSLFVDLVVSRGEVPCYLQLAGAERARFFTDVALPAETDLANAEKDRVRKTLDTLKRPDTEVKGWLAGESVNKLSDKELSLLWYVKAAHHLEDAVGEDAAGRVLKTLRTNIDSRGVNIALAQPVADFGLLSLVVRMRGTMTGRLVATVAAGVEWTWAQGNESYLLGLFLVALVLSAMRFGLLFVSNYAAAVASLEVAARLRRAIYHHTHRLGTLASLTPGPDEAVSASTRHVELLHEGLYRWLTVYFREPVKAGLLLLFALLVNFWLALAFLLFAVLVWMVAGQSAAHLRRRGRAAQARAANELALIQESLGLTRLVKGYLMEPFNQARVERQLRLGTEAQLARYRDEAIYRPLFALLGLAAAIVLLLAAGYIVLQGHLGVAGAAVLTTALVCLYWPVRAILETQRALRRGSEAARSLFGFLDKQGGVAQPLEAEFLPALSEALEFDKVTVQEAGSGRKLLRSVSLRIEAGKRVAIVGPDPMEKYALAFLLPRFLDPISGEVRINGKNLRWVTVDSLRAQIGMVLQRDLVFNDSVVNNIGCGDPAYSLNRIVEAAKIAHAHQFILKLPQGYETPIGDKGHALNPGELFRIGLARAILRDPAVFVIEEPTAALDDDTKALIDDTIQRILPNRTAIFLPRRLSTIRGCDQVFLLYQGRIAAVGDHRELLATSDLYKHLQYLQFNEFAGNVGGATPVATPVTEEV
jgi:ATP-binding cassette subfamily B protein